MISGGFTLQTGRVDAGQAGSKHDMRSSFLLEKEAAARIHPECAGGRSGRQWMPVDTREAAGAVHAAARPDQHVVRCSVSRLSTGAVSLDGRAERRA